MRLRTVQIAFIFMCLIAFSAFAQNSKVDSLRARLNLDMLDSTQVDLYNELSQELVYAKPIEALETARKALELATESDLPNRVATSHNRMGKAYYQLGEYESALKEYFIALKQNELSHDKYSQFSDYNNIGLVYLASHEYDRAVEYYYKALDIAQKLPGRQEEAVVSNNIGQAFLKKKNVSLSKEYFNVSYQINDSLNNETEKAINLNNLGELYFVENQFGKAKEYFLRATMLNGRSYNKFELAQNYNNLGKTCFSLKQYELAEEYLMKSFALAMQIEAKELIAVNHQLKAHLFKETKRFELAFDELTHYYNMQADLHSLEKDRVLERTHALYQMETKEKEIAVLKLDNLIKSQQAEEERSIRMYVVISMVFLVILLILIIRQYRSANKQNVTLNSLVKERTKELEVAKEDAVKSDKLKTSFLMNMSHEVRTPMNAIEAFTKMMKTEVSNAEKEEFSDIVLKNTRYLLSLFENITLLARLESGEYELSNQFIELNELSVEINNEAELYLKALGKDHLRIENVFNVSIFNGETASINHAREIKLILLHILHNAIKFTNQGKIEIGMHVNRDNVNFYIRDTGPGVAIDKRDLVFEKFTKFSPYPNELFDGGGLGLTISKKVSSLLNGSVALHSVMDEGTTFSLKVPYSLVKIPEQVV